MATVTEIEGSRVGALRGKGASGYNVRLLVRPDESDWIDIDGTKVPPDPCGLAAEVWPYGTGHPFDANMKVVNWRQDQCLTSALPGMWIVSVLFEPEGPSNPPSSASGDWLISVRGASITRTLYEELPDPRAPLSQQTPRIIGPRTFVTASDDDQDALFKTKKKNAEGQEQLLKPTGEVDPQPIQVPWPASTVNFTRVQPNFSEWAMGDLVYYKAATNAKKWRGAAPHHVVLADYVVDPIEQIMPGQLVEGRAWRITLPFVFSSIPWTPQEKVPLWRDKEGTEWIVYHTDDDPTGEQRWKAGDKVVDAFRVRRETDFEKLFSLLNRASRGK